MTLVPGRPLVVVDVTQDDRLVWLTRVSHRSKQSAERAIGVRLPQRGPLMLADAVVAGIRTGAAADDDIRLGMHLHDVASGSAHERGQRGRIGDADGDAARREIFVAALPDVGGKGRRDAAWDHDVARWRACVWGSMRGKVRLHRSYGSLA